MRYLVFTNTPAHVHLYRNLVDRLRGRGHDVLVLARDVGPTVPLLEYYDLPYRVYGHNEETKGSLAVNLPAHAARIVRWVPPPIGSALRP
jgi:predicted glycosyltransferase